MLLVSKDIFFKHNRIIIIQQEEWLFGWIGKDINKKQFIHHFETLYMTYLGIETDSGCCDYTNDLPESQMLFTRVIRKVDNRM